MTVLKRALLLCLLNILTTAHVEKQCNLNSLFRWASEWGWGWEDLDIFRCNLGNIPITVDPVNHCIYFECQGKNLSSLSYHGPTKVEQNMHIARLVLLSCSPSNIISFLNNVIVKPIIEYAELRVTSKSMSLSSADMDSLNKIGCLILTLETDTTIPIINATHPWSSLKKLSIWGGKLNNLQLSNDTEVDMTRLPADSFSGLKSLIQLDIQNNKNIETISANALRGLNELQRFILKYSSIKFIEVDAFSGTPMLKSLDLSYNLLESLPNGWFQNLEHLVEIFLQGNQLKFIGSEAFAQLPSLKTIDISNCTITRLPENVFTGSDNIETLRILHNFITSLSSKIFRHQRSLKKLYLNYNKLRDPRKYNFNNLKELEILDLSNNEIEILPKSLFLDLSDLREINLSNNKITFINKDLVTDPRDIELMYDKIDNLEYEEIIFKLLTKLRTLNLAGNQIIGLNMYLSDDWQALLNLKHLNISGNKISFIDYLLDMNFINSHTIIDLSYNQITEVNCLEYISPTNRTEANSSMILTGNPINCNCYSYGLHLRLNGANPPDEPNYIFEDHCSSPPHLKGQRLKDISPELLICNHTDASCYESCSSCIIAKSEIVLNCRELPSQDLINIINFRVDVEVQRLVLNMDNQPKSLEDRHFHKLNLSNAGIQSLTFIPNDHLKILDVSHNNLTAVPDVYLKANYTIYLSNNPLKCDCQFVQVIFALNDSGLLPDFNEMTCVNEGKVAQIDINELCGRSVRLVSIIGWSTIGSFVAIVTVIKLYLNANKIWLSFLKTFCKRRYKKTWNEMRKLGIEETKQYDLFISFAHGDTEFVTETLLPKLENEFSQKVCIHTRDWIVGNVIANQIIESVENSRRTVVILSEHFLMSEWAELEFYTAHTWGTQEGKVRIIIILLKEEVARDERISKELKAYLVTNTYLLWGDPLFWEKLQKVLPAKIPKYVW